MPGILFYVNSHYGLGHYHRIYNIVQTLRNRFTSAHITILYSGVPTDIFERTNGWRALRLPGFSFWDNGISDEMQPVDRKEDVNVIFKKRMSLIREVLHRSEFKVLITEYFPFSKYQLADEVINVISLFKRKSPEGYVVSSVRDIVHDMSNDKLELVNAFIRQYFDYIMVHSDPRVISFNYGSNVITEFADKMVYTGFVTSNNGKPTGKKRDNGHPGIVISAGGGRDGYSLLKLFVSALQTGKLKTIMKTPVSIFPGPFFPQGKLLEIAGDMQSFREYNIEIKKTYEYFTARDGASLSFSMCGYNTCYDLLARKIPTLFFPRQRKEQLYRARLFDRLKVSRIIHDAGELAEAIERELSKDNRCPSSHIDIDFSGAEKTADFLASLCQQ